MCVEVTTTLCAQVTSCLFPERRVCKNDAPRHLLITEFKNEVRFTKEAHGLFTNAV
jgi:hypothetical protein